MFRHLARIASIVMLAMGSSVLLPDPAAAQYMFRDAGPAFPVHIPPDWKTSRIDKGIETRSPGDEVIMWIQGTQPSGVDALLDAYIAYYKSQGVHLTGAAEKVEETVRGAKVVAMTVPATWKGKPTVVKFTLVGSRKQGGPTIVMGYWASPKADEEYQGDITQITIDLVRPEGD